MDWEFCRFLNESITMDILISRLTLSIKTSLLLVFIWFSRQNPNLQFVQCQKRALHGSPQSNQQSNLRKRLFSTRKSRNITEITGLVCR